MPDSGKVLYAVDQGHWVFRFEGNIRFTLAYPLDAFIERAFAASKPVTLVADLRDIESIDSTGIGLLVKMARVARESGTPRPTLFCGNPDVTEILDSMCLDSVFTMVSGELHPSALTPLPALDVSEQDLAATIEQAHRLLCKLSEQNRIRFEGVVEAFSRLSPPALARQRGEEPWK